MRNQSIQPSQYDIKAANLVGAVGHHAFFLTSASAQNRIQIHVNRILAFGLKQYLNEEYLSTIQNNKLSKSFIINEIENRHFLLDGNLHMVAIILALPATTIGDIVQAAGRADIIRFWKNGYEDSPAIQKNPYDTYIPLHICTDKIAGAHKGMDYFKNPPEEIFIIPSNIPYDSMLFSPPQQGQPLGITAMALTERYKQKSTHEKMASCSSKNSITEENHIPDLDSEIDLEPYDSYTGMQPDEQEIRKYQLTVEAKKYISEGNYLAGANTFAAIAAICKTQGKTADAHRCEVQAFHCRQRYFLKKANIKPDVFTSLPVVEVLQVALTELAEKAARKKNYHENVFYLELNSALCKAQGKERDAYLLDTTIYANKKLIDPNNTTDEKCLYEKLSATYEQIKE